MMFPFSVKSENFSVSAFYILKGCPENRFGTSRPQKCLLIPG
jgi:hypothetical protein